MNDKDPKRYDDIINMKRPESRRARMDIKDRAAQFAPFAALTGHGEAVNDTAERNEEHYADFNANEIFNEDP